MGLLSNTYCDKIYCNGRSNSHLIISGVLQTFTIYIITKHVLKAHDTKHKKDESLGHLADYCIQGNICPHFSLLLPSLVGVN